MLSKTKYPYLTDPERALLTSEQALKLNKFTRDQNRRDRAWLDHTEYVPRSQLEDHTPGCIDMEEQLGIEAMELGLEGTDRRVAVMLGQGYTVRDIAADMDVPRSTVQDRIARIRQRIDPTRGKESELSN